MRKRTSRSSTKLDFQFQVVRSELVRGSEVEWWSGYSVTQKFPRSAFQIAINWCHAKALQCSTKMLCDASEEEQMSTQDILICRRNHLAIAPAPLVMREILESWVYKSCFVFAALRSTNMDIAIRNAGDWKNQFLTHFEMVFSETLVFRGLDACFGLLGNSSALWWIG